MNTGTQIKQCRKQKKLSQDRLAKLVGVRQTAISNYELGLSQPSLRVLQELCRVLEVSADAIVSGTTNQTS